MDRGRKFSEETKGKCLGLKRSEDIGTRLHSGSLTIISVHVETTTPALPTRRESVKTSVETEGREQKCFANLKAFCKWNVFY